MDAILAFVKKLYGQKEKLILGILVLAFIGVAAYEFMPKKNGGSDNGGNDNPNEIISTKWSPPPQPETYSVQPLTNAYKLDTYKKLVSKKNIFEKPRKETDRDKRGKAASEWAKIKVKSVFDPTQTGTYIAIIEVDKRSRIVKEGQQFDQYEVRRIDGVRSCISIRMRDSDEEKEFCKED